MDISQQYDLEKHIAGDMNYQPIAKPLNRQLQESGLAIISYFDQVPEPPRKQPYPMRNFNYYCLSHLIDGQGYYDLEGIPEVVPLKPGDLICAMPGYPQSYGCLEGVYVEDSICFIGPLADVLRRNGILRNQLLHFGRERRLSLIIQQLRRQTTASVFAAHAMLYSLLVELGNADRLQQVPLRPHPLTLLLEELNRQSQHWWTVAEMAAFCNISENYLRTLFRERLRTTPKEYIDRLKLNHAAKLLAGSDLSIAAVARTVGYRDAYHFSRRFSALMRQTPTQYRHTAGTLTSR